MEFFESVVSDNSTVTILKDPQAFVQATLPKLSEMQRAALEQMHEVRGDILLALGGKKRALLEFTCACAVNSLGNASKKKRKVEDHLRKLSNKVPCTILIGCYGSGKTTLANRILESQPCNRIAVIESEFGAAGIDQTLADYIMASEEEVISRGCACSTVRGDLIRSLKYLHKKSAAESKPVDRILIETSSFPDLAPLVQTFFANDFVESKFSLDCIVACVDANEIGQRLKEGKAVVFETEAAAQLAFADRIVINKADLVDEEMLVQIGNHIALINPTAPVERVWHSEINMKHILDIDAWSLDNALDTDHGFRVDSGAHKVITCSCLEGSVRCFNMAGQEVFSSPVPPGEEPFAPWLWRAAQERIANGRLHLINTNGEDIWLQEHVSSVCIDVPGEVNKEKFDHWLEVLISDRENILSRFKGSLAVQGQQAPFMLQGFGQLFMGSANTQRVWQADEQRRCKIVFMGSNLNMDQIISSFTECMVEPPQHDASMGWMS
jgi:G3E family GTPase